MIKKLSIIIFAITMFFLCYKNSKKSIIIPSSSIRYRILANSNTIKDQNIKENINMKIQKDLYYILKESNNKKDAKISLLNNMPILDNTLKKETKKLSHSYKINYGYHYFPEKEFNGKKYDEGYYESLLITLGEGKGDNFWCVLFPPFCTIQADNDEIKKDVEYKFFIKKIIEKYF